MTFMIIMFAFIAGYLFRFFIEWVANYENPEYEETGFDTSGPGHYRKL